MRSQRMNIIYFRTAVFKLECSLPSVKNQDITACNKHLSFLKIDAKKGVYESVKLRLINEIGTDNVEIVILRHGLTEKEALEIESVCIDLWIIVLKLSQ